MLEIQYIANPKINQKSTSKYRKIVLSKEEEVKPKMFLKLKKLVKIMFKN